MQIFSQRNREERSDTETPVCRVEMSEFEILQQNATQSDNNSLSLQ